MVMSSGEGAGATNALAQRVGRYRLITKLGEGGMGTIHLAVAGGLGGFRKLFVLKILKEELALDDRFIELFLREATLAACLNHPNVVHTVEAGRVDHRYFLVMEFLDGQPLGEIVRRAEQEPQVPLYQRLQVLCEVLSGLHYAHELTDYDGRALQLMHRDVSPPNIFVTYDGQVKLVDFGIAKARDSEATQPGEFKGKVSYAAPEQLRSGFPTDRRVDVFAAGVVLWELIALRNLLRGKPKRAAVEARLSGTEPRIAQVVPSVDPALAAICDRAMHHDPDQRYSTADAFRGALVAYLAERGAPPTASALAPLMRAKFASERAAMHRLIDTRLRDGADDEPADSASGSWSFGARESQIRPSGRVDFEPPSSRSERDSLLSAVQPRPLAGTALRWLVGLVLAALTLAALLLRGMQSSEPTEASPRVDMTTRTTPATPEERVTPREAPPREDPRAEPDEPPSSAVDGKAVLPPVPGEASRGEAGPRLAPSAKQQPSLPRQESRAKRARSNTRALDARESVRNVDTKSLAARKADRKRLAARTADAKPTTRARAAEAKRSSGGRVAKDAGLRELDLRQVDKREPRKLDLENPFR